MRVSPIRVACSVLATCLLVTASARSSESAEPVLDEVVVTGEFPGPGLWKITRADESSGHALWIFAEPWPLPKRLTWKSKHIEATAANAQEILWDAGFSVTSDEKIGLWRGMTLLPAALKARRNPDDGKLVDLLPPDLYARWQAQKKLYLGNGRSIESWRPLFAAFKLREAAFDELELRPGSAVSAVIRKLAKKHGIKMTEPMVTVKFKRSEIRDRIREFSKESLADLECLGTTLALTEALARRDVETTRAKAWAAGDLATLAALPDLPNPGLPCGMAIATSQAARDLVPADVREQVTDKWLAAVDASLAANQSTFAVVAIGKLTRAGGYLDLLRARGYRIEAPQ
jgi:hypothetical protein